ncbi:DUF5667 domain-containing protein [Chloroflexota bacterium]
MKHMKLKTVIISCLLITSFLLSGTAYAQDADLPDPGITPDSPLYVFDNWGKSIGMFFAFGPEAKAKKALNYAEEKLAEAQVMAAKNKVKEMTRAANDYDGFMAMVNERAEEARRAGNSDDLSERVAVATSNHLTVLDRLKDQVPEEAGEAIIRARTASMKGQTNALRALAEAKPERALEINSANMEKRLNRARIKASENITTEVEKALEDTAELVEIEEEISEIARELGIDSTAIEKLTAIANSNRLEVLAGVYEKVPEQARQGIARAMENSLTKYDRTVEKLKEKNALGEVSEDNPTIERLRAEIQEKLRVRTSNGVQDAANISGNITAKVRAQEQVRESVEANVERQTQKLKPETAEPSATANKTKDRQEDTKTNKAGERNP